ncbi:MAG: glucosamine-6-phosphate deaminase [bacterium]
MKILTFDNYQLMSAKAADLVIALINDQPNCVVAWPTGQTPLALYQELTAECQQGETSFQQLISFNLDNYVGLAHDHPASYERYMQENFFSQVDVPKTNIYMPDGQAEDLDWVCDDYERALQEVGGLDLAILGLGLNGHLAFNEPGTLVDSLTHVVDLSATTRQANVIAFKNIEEVPKQAITMGLGTILSAQQIILLVSGDSKKDIVKQALQGSITPEVPASYLQQHRNVIVILDKAAATELN